MGRALLLLLIEKIFSWAGRKFSLGREQIFLQEVTIPRSCICSRVVRNFRSFANGKRYSVTGVTAKIVGGGVDVIVLLYIIYILYNNKK